MMKKFQLKNILLLSTLGLGLLHTQFNGLETRVDWYLFIDLKRRLDIATMYLTTCINFIILSFCLMYPKGISRDVKRFILILTILDLVHYFTFSKIYFGIYKIGIAIFIFYGYKYYKKWLT